MSSQPLPRLVMVTGQRRSGTSLMANLLDAQAEVQVRRDFLGIARLHRVAGLPRLDAPLAPPARRAVVAAYERQNRRLALSAAAVADLDRLAPAPDAGPWALRDLYVEVLAGLSSGSTQVVGHKTTMAEPILEALLDAVEPLHVVYMVRDPRDVVVSAVARFPQEPPLGFVSQWREGVQRVRDLEARRPDLRERLTWVRYEDLVADPDRSMEVVATRIGLAGTVAAPDQVLDYGAAWSGNSSFEVREAGVSRAAVGRAERAPELSRLVEVAVGDLIGELGWPRPRPASAGERRALALRRGADAVVGAALRATAKVDEGLRRARRRVGRGG